MCCIYADKHVFFLLKALIAKIASNTLYEQNASFNISFTRF